MTEALIIEIVKLKIRGKFKIPGQWAGLNFFK
jgi:hypothetical protein